MKRQRINKKQDIRNNKAITLIALVVTIVVLLILAGVSIAMLTGENGIIKQAQDSKENTRGADVKETVDLAINNNKILDYANTTGEKETKEDVIDKLKAEGKLTDEEITDIAEDNKVTIGDIEIDFSGLEETTGGGSGGENETTLPLPENAVVSQIPKENESVEKGIVIYIIPEEEQDTVDWKADSDNDGIIDVQEKYDQFVWVPVPNAVATDDTDLATKNGNGIYPMAVAIEGTDSKGNQNYRGVLYNFSETTDAEGEKYVKITAKSYSATSGYREPSYLKHSSYGDASSYNTVGITEDLLQEEFNAMVKSVNAKKGFWVGRYETSNMVGTATTSRNDALNQATVEADKTNRVTVIRGTTTGISYDSAIPNWINWYRMYAQQKNYSKLVLGSTTTTTSSMIWGSQWDQIMIWMKEEPNERVTTYGNYFVTNSAGYGNYGSISGAEEYDKATSTIGPATTGSSENFKVKNVYDLAGNVYDWSLEASSSGGRVLRGGHYYNTNSSYTRADRRGSNYSDSSYCSTGSRSTLY